MATEGGIRIGAWTGFAPPKEPCVLTVEEVRDHDSEGESETGPRNKD